MPITDSESEATDQEQLAAPEAPAPEAAPAPDYDAKIEALRQELQASQQQNMALMQQGFQMLQESQRQTATRTTQVELTDEQLEQMLAEGKGAAAIRQMIQSATSRTKDEVARESVAPLAELVQTHGIEAIAALARQAAEDSMPETLKPYAQRYKTEIEQAIAGMAPALKLKVDNIKYAQNLILGNHLQEIVEDERQKVVRQFRDNPSSLPGAAAGRQGASKEPGVPTAEELFGRNSPEAKMIAQAGGENAYIAKFAKAGKGYSQTWAEYVQRHQAMSGQEPKGNA